MHLQKVAVCFGGRPLAGILLHLAATGTFSGMPDNTIIRAAIPSAAGGAPEPIDVEAWPLREVTPPPVQVC